ncbi:MAG: hypothetical protein R3E31_01185 [Chloroflexota bacterium]
MINLALQVGDRALEGNGRMHYGIALWRQGHYPQAVVYHAGSYAVAAKWQAKTTDHIAPLLGIIAYEQGVFAASKANYQELLTLRRALGDRQTGKRPRSTTWGGGKFPGRFCPGSHTLPSIQITHSPGNGAPSAKAHCCSTWVLLSVIWAIGVLQRMPI